jgi:hypothetical protein
VRSTLATAPDICVGCLLCIGIEPSAAVTGGAEPVGPQSSLQLAAGHSAARSARRAHLSVLPNGYPSGRRNDSQRHSLTSMDRFYLAIIVSALLLLLGATGIFVTRTADLMPHARTVGVAGSR